MAGRPKTMARKVLELENLTCQAMMKIWAIAPPQYREKPRYYRKRFNTNDLLAAAWFDAIQATYLAVTTFENLGDFLRIKAGISESGPIDDLYDKVYSLMDPGRNEPAECDMSPRKREAGGLADSLPDPPGRSGAGNPS